jgi:hypothetical protein
MKTSILIPGRCGRQGCGISEGNPGSLSIRNRFAAVLLVLLSLDADLLGQTFESQPINRWVKLSPLPSAPASPRLGYEGACVWDSRHRLLVRYGGHNQGGGGEQGSEVWTFDPLTARWALKLPNTSPPGVCCNAQNVYDPSIHRYIRFPFFSGSHGWQWWRELYLNDSSVWTYDLAANCWRNMRPLPAPRLAPYRCASWDANHRCVVLFGGEGSSEGTLIYDPWQNQWRWPKPDVEPAPRSGGNMAYDVQHKVHVLFGSQFTDDPYSWVYDVERNEWQGRQPDPMPPTNQNDAVLTYDSINRVILAIVKVTSGEEENARHEVQTWAYDTGKNQWTFLKPSVEPDAAGNRTRNLIFAPELNVAILENCTSRPREQQVFAYRYANAATNQDRHEAAPRQTPPIVEDAIVSVITRQRVQIDWTAPMQIPVAGYLVDRAPVEVWSDDQLVRLKRNTPPLAETSVGAIRRIGSFKTLTAEPILATSFVDDTVDLGTPSTIDGETTYDRELGADHLDREGRPYRLGVFAYRIRTVDSGGKISGPSPAYFTIPSSPQHVFSREDGETCLLKWAANPEQGIAGYRIYRMDGRWNEDPISRLTSEPVSATTYVDMTARMPTRRYYVVAVDELGQEGFPSAPVWSKREWQAYYAPFVGEWHQ